MVAGRRNQSCRNTCEQCATVVCLSLTSRSSRRLQLLIGDQKYLWYYMQVKIHDSASSEIRQMRSSFLFLSNPLTWTSTVPLSWPCKHSTVNVWGAWWMVDNSGLFPLQSRPSRSLYTRVVAKTFAGRLSHHQLSEARVFVTVAKVSFSRGGSIWDSNDTCAAFQGSHCNFCDSQGWMILHSAIGPRQARGSWCHSSRSI